MLYLMLDGLTLFCKGDFTTYNVSRMISRGGILDGVSNFRADSYFKTTTILFDIIKYGNTCKKSYSFINYSILKNSLTIHFTEKPPGMHQCSCNDAVPWLNTVKSRLFQSTVNFKHFKIHLHSSACLP